jgi:hypothetical protein
MADDRTTAAEVLAVLRAALAEQAASLAAAERRIDEGFAAYPERPARS